MSEQPTRVSPIDHRVVKADQEREAAYLRVMTRLSNREITAQDAVAQLRAAYRKADRDFRYPETKDNSWMSQKWT